MAENATKEMTSEARRTHAALTKKVLQVMAGLARGR